MVVKKWILNIKMKERPLPRDDKTLYVVNRCQIDNETECLVIISTILLTSTIRDKSSFVRIQGTICNEFLFKNHME